MKRIVRGRPTAILAACVAGGAPVAATTIIVTPATLTAAFNAAQGGDTLKLVGAFAGERLSNRTFSKLVTIDASAATFTDKFELDNVSNVKFSGGRFDLSADPEWTRGILVNGGKNVYVDSVRVIGSGTQWGVSFVDTGNAQITNGVFSQLNAAVLFGTVSSGVVGHNTITASESDGIDIANSHFVTASYNNCSAGVPGAGVHPDCIQLWSVAGDPLQSDITVTNNQATGATQGFTSFAGGGGGLRIKFLANTANVSFPQGVACYDCIDSVIGNNRVTTLAGSTYQTTINVVGGSGNIEYGNSIAAYQPPRPTVSLVADGAIARPTDDTTTMDMLTRAILANSGAAAVPEPSTWALLIAGFAAVGLARRASLSRTAGRRGCSMA